MQNIECYENPAICSQFNQHDGFFRPYLHADNNVANRVHAADDVLVRITRASICQADRRVLLGTKSHNFFKRSIILGHEGGGYIINPDGSNDYRKQQKCVLLPHLSCWGSDCAFCSNNNPNLCPKLQHLGFHIDGVLSNYGYFHKKCVYPVCSEFPEDALPLIEPLACILHGITKIKSELDVLNAEHKKSENKLVIYGAGPIGCLTALYVKHKWPQLTIDIIDPLQTRRYIAQEITHSTVSSCYSGEEKPAISFIANSFFETVQYALNNTSPQGVVVLFSGINSDYFTHETLGQYAMDIETIHRQEKTVILDSTLKLIGSSGFNFNDVHTSVTELMHDYSSYAHVQNCVIDGLSSNVIRYTYPVKKEINLQHSAVEAMLSPLGIYDPQYGEIIAATAKTLIKI